MLCNTRPISPTTPASHSGKPAVIKAIPSAKRIKKSRLVSSLLNSPGSADKFVHTPHGGLCSRCRGQSDVEQAGLLHELAVIGIPRGDLETARRSLGMSYDSPMRSLEL